MSKRSNSLHNGSQNRP